MALSALGKAPAAVESVPLNRPDDAKPRAQDHLRPSGISAPHLSQLAASSNVPRWILTHHRTAPQALLGQQRSGHLVPTSGSLMGHTYLARFSSGKQQAADHKTADKSKGWIPQDDSTDTAMNGSKLGALLGDDSGIRLAAVGGGAGFGSNENSQSHGDGTGSQLDSAQKLQTATDAMASSDLGAEQGVHALLTADNLHKLEKQAAYWTTSIRLAMECAVAHPGADLFVQAFTMVDAEGNLISNFRKQARLRADGQGKVTVSAHSNDAAAQITPAHDEQLLGELSAAPLMMLSLKATVDESGNIVTAFADAAKAEYALLLKLFNRPLAGKQAITIHEDQSELQKLWTDVCMHPQIFENLPLFGDALRRQLVQARVAPSETISLHNAQSYRAHQNWLRTNDVLERWASDKRTLDLAGLKQVNAMLGEGLKPWNKAAQADSVGAKYGELRTVDVVSGVPPSYYLRADRVGQALRELFLWLDIQQINNNTVVLVAAQFYQRLVSIHPFFDGNGRTARLMLDWLLQMHGWPPVLLDGNAALFPNGVDHITPGSIEKALIEGIRKAIEVHVDALRLDEQSS